MARIWIDLPDSLKTSVLAAIRDKLPATDSMTDQDAATYALAAHFKDLCRTHALRHADPAAVAAANDLAAEAYQAHQLAQAARVTAERHALISVERDFAQFLE